MGFKRVKDVVSLEYNGCVRVQADNIGCERFSSRSDGENLLMIRTNAGHANWFVSSSPRPPCQLSTISSPQFVLAVTDPSASGSKRMTAFVVDGDAEGVVRGKKEVNMGECRLIR
jgi:hypothetical protein